MYLFPFSFSACSLPGVQKPVASSHDGDWILYDGANILQFLSMKFPSCHPSGTLNFEVAFGKFLHPCVTVY